MNRFCCALLMIMLPCQVLAGAWPRERGSTFLSFSTLVTTPSDAIGDDLSSTPSIYVERGGRRDLTFGLDAQMSFDGDYSAFVFVRKPVAQRFDTHRFAVLAGAGVSTSANDSELILRLGAAWGKGLKLNSLSGWAAVDATADYQTETGEVALKADLTLGLKPSEKTKLILQFQSGDYPGSDPYLRAAPSVVLQVGEGRHLELGVQVGLKGDDRVGLKMGTWLEF